MFAAGELKNLGLELAQVPHSFPILPTVTLVSLLFEEFVDQVVEPQDVGVRVERLPLIPGGKDH